MAYRSWLKDVKRLDDLATFMHFFPNNHRDWDREVALEDKMYAHIKNRPIPVDSGLDVYFRATPTTATFLGYLRDISMKKNPDAKRT